MSAARARDGLTLADVPIRVRATSNPGGAGHGWVKSHFVDPETRQPGVVLPARPGSSTTRTSTEPLRRGARDPPGAERAAAPERRLGRPRRRRAVPARLVPADRPQPAPEARDAVRYWDLAATEPGPANPDPDYTVGLRLDKDASGKFTIRDNVRGRWSEDVVERKVRQTAVEDGRGVDVYIEQEPGASGKSLLGYYKRQVLQGYVCYSGLVNSGNKEVRSRPAAAAVANGLVSIVRGENLIPFLDEASMFPNGEHDDCVDAFSGAHTAITRSTGRAPVSGPRGRIAGIERVHESGQYGYAG